jgi:hypothetical protein
MTPAATPMRLTLDVTDDSWVVLDADGKEAINELMRRGAHRTVEAKDSFHFRTIGNAGGIKLALNDVPLPAVGRDGEVIHDRIVGRGDVQRNP